MRKLLFPLLFIFIIATPGLIHAQELTTFILVRHAEKKFDNTKDPALSREGLARAQQLSELLSKAELNAIYSTDYRRTMQTAKPTAEAKGIDIRTYDPHDKSFLTPYLTNNAGGTVLIVGHSNTTPNLVNSLLEEERVTKIDEDDYGNIYMVTTSKNSPAKVIHLQY